METKNHVLDDRVISPSFNSFDKFQTRSSGGSRQNTYFDYTSRVVREDIEQGRLAATVCYRKPVSFFLDSYLAKESEISPRLQALLRAVEEAQRLVACRRINRKAAMIGFCFWLRVAIGAATG